MVKNNHMKENLEQLKKQLGSRFKFSNLILCPICDNPIRDVEFSKEVTQVGHKKTCRDYLKKVIHTNTT